MNHLQSGHIATDGELERQLIVGHSSDRKSVVIALECLDHTFQRLTLDQATRLSRDLARLVRALRRNGGRDDH